MARYFQKSNGNPLDTGDSTVLRARLSPGTRSGFPEFIPFNRHIFEFPDDEDLTRDREGAIVDAGYEEIQRPPEDERIHITRLLLI